MVDTNNFRIYNKIWRMKNSEDPNKKGANLRNLGDFLRDNSPREIINEFIEVLRTEKNDEVKLEALDGLSYTGEKGSLAIPILLELAYRDENEEIRYLASRRLIDLSKYNPEIIPKLLPIIKNDVKIKGQKKLRNNWEKWSKLPGEFIKGIGVGIEPVFSEFENMLTNNKEFKKYKEQYFELLRQFEQLKNLILSIQKLRQKSTPELLEHLQKTTQKEIDLEYEELKEIFDILKKRNEVGSQTIDTLFNLNEKYLDKEAKSSFIDLLIQINETVDIKPRLLEIIRKGKGSDDFLDVGLLALGRIDPEELIEEAIRKTIEVKEKGESKYYFLKYDKQISKSANEKTAITLVDFLRNKPNLIPEIREELSKVIFQMSDFYNKQQYLLLVIEDLIHLMLYDENEGVCNKIAATLREIDELFNIKISNQQMKEDFIKLVKKNFFDNSLAFMITGLKALGNNITEELLSFIFEERCKKEKYHISDEKSWLIMEIAYRHANEYVPIIARYFHEEENELVQESVIYILNQLVKRFHYNSSEELIQAVEEYNQEIVKRKEELQERIIDREERFRKILKRYTEISFTRLSKALGYDNVVALRNWLDEQANSYGLTVQNDKLIIPKALQSDSSEAEEVIESLLNSFEEFEQKGLGKKV